MQEEFVVKSIRMKEGEKRAGRAAYSEGTEEGERIIILPVMAATAPGGPLWFQRAARLLWDDENAWIYSSPCSRHL